MAREKTFSIRLTKGEPETVQRLLEVAASDSTTNPAAIGDLARIDSAVYRALYPELTQPKAKLEQQHPMALRHLRVVPRT